jgi:hypothetical protein
MTIKPNPATQWIEELCQSKGLALAKTYAKLIEVVEHLSA